MAAPAYTEDLTDIDLAESVTGYAAYGGGAAGLGAGPDFAMQGTNCVDKQITAAEKGMVFDNGSPITIPAGDHVFQWLFNATPGVADSLVNRGAVVCVGDDTTNFVKYHVEGNDTYGAGGRVGKCYCIDPSVKTANTGSIPYRTLVGTPTTNQVFGTGLSTTASVKSANLGCDAMRYGTGAYITAGEVANPATFDGFATQNDSSTNRWGILSKIGAAYELQGRFVIGQDNTKTATLAYFDDSDANISFVDSVHAAADFTQIIIDHASTTCNFTNVSLTALGTINKGKFVVNANNPTVSIVGGSWTSIGTTVLRSNTTVDGLTWRLTDSITLNQATLDNCVIDRCIAASAVLTDDLGDLTLNNFIGDNTGHAVELSSIGGGSMTWNNTFDTTTYATADGSTGNEAIYVNVGTGTLTINVSTGATTPTIRTAGATVVVVAGAVDVTVKVTDTGGADIQNANVLLKASDGTGPFPYKESVTITRSGTVATVSHTAHGMDTNDKVDLKGITDKTEDNNVKQITKIDANSYSFATTNLGSTNYTGTITSTFAALQGLTNVSGIITISRTYASNQPVTGWARKSSASPYYRQAGLGGIIDSGTGFSASPQLILDE